MIKKYLLIISLMLFSCNKENEVTELKYSPFIGEYKILSLTSDIEIDLNRDGVATKNYLIELSSYFSTYKDIEPTLVIYNSTENIKNAFYDDIPKQFVNETDLNDIKYYKSGPIKTLKYNNDFSKVVSIDGNYKDEYYKNQKWAILKDIEIIDNNNISATFEQQYFTIETGWKICNLKALFRKIK